MASQPIWGKVYTCFEPKSTYLLSLVIFGVGSILCAVSPISACLIVGLTTGIRAIVQIAKKLPFQEQAGVKNLLDFDITRAFILPLVATSAAAIASWAIEWRKIKEDREAPALMAMS